MKDKSTHALPSFTGYLNKVFHFRDAIQQLSDARQDPEISPQSVFLAVFHSFLFRLPSFQQLEADLAEPHFQHRIGVERAFRDDVSRYSLCGFDLDSLQRMLVAVNRRLKRDKAFDESRVQGRSSPPSTTSKCCPARRDGWKISRNLDPRNLDPRNLDLDISRRHP